MPTYQYQCTECHEPMEAQQSFSDEALTECPQCEGRLRKVFNAVGVVFKGSGFYRNDSRPSSASGDPAKSTSKDSSSSKPAETSTATATPATPAKKSGSDSAA